MPPLRLSTRLNPTDRRKSAALALRRAHLAVDDDLVVRVELGIAGAAISPSGMSIGPGNPIDLILVRLPHVDEGQLVAAIEPLLQLDRRDFGALLAARHVAVLRRGRSDAAELFVVDQLRDRRDACRTPGNPDPSSASARGNASAARRRSGTVR